MERHIEKLSHGMNFATTQSSVGPYSGETRTDSALSQECFKTKGWSETTLRTISIDSWDALQQTLLTYGHISL